MKILATIGFTINALLFTALLFTRSAPVFDPSVAKLVVRERLERYPALAREWTGTPSCAEQHGSEGVVSGHAQTHPSSKNLDGMAVSETMKFNYRAQLSATCMPYNPNCYDVNSMYVNGTQIIAPRL